MAAKQKTVQRAMIRIEDFTVRERNVLTLPQSVRDASHLDAGTQGKAVAVREGLVMLITDPLLVDELVAHVAAWLDERAARDPWANLNDALAADNLDKIPNERYVAPIESDSVPNVERIVSLYSDDDTLDVAPPERRWRE